MAQPQFHRRLLKSRLVAMTRWLSQTVRPPVAPPPSFSNTATGYLQANGLVKDVKDVMKLLPLPPTVIEPILGIIDGVLGALDEAPGKDSPKAREAPLDAVKHFSAGQTTQSQGEADHGREEHAASEDSSMEPFVSKPEAPTPPARAPNLPAGVPNLPSGVPNLPPGVPNPPAGLPMQPRSGPARRQNEESNGGSKGKSTAPGPPGPPPLPAPPLPTPTPPSGPGAYAGGSG